MKNDECCSFGTGSVLLSFLLGGLVGAGLALLLAPQSGPDTRRKIREFAGDTAERTSEYLDEAKEKAGTYVSQAKGRVTATVEKAKNLFEDKKSAVAAAVEAGKEAYDKEVNKETA
ncbi:MAG: YtxH domain-containing protein [Dissulfurispiraceae bacterium]